MDINQAYKKALVFAKSHYENFPVVSFLIPRSLRKDIAIIYWFARTADDIADEGNFSADERIEKLSEFKKRFEAAVNNEFQDELDYALNSTIKKHCLTHSLFYDLISAFQQDVTKTRYSSFTELQDYCKRSANPVGRLILELFNIRDEKAFAHSDSICTALQLTNFYQDIEIDYKKGRIYIPQSEMQLFGVEEQNIAEGILDEKYKALIHYQIMRTRDLFKDGYNLIPFLSGRLKYEILWTLKGGESILTKIKNADFDVFTKRPINSKKDILKILFGL